MRCSKCGRENRAGRRFCARCGELSLVCASCKAANEPGEQFCGDCGQRIAEPAEVRPHSYTPRHLVEKILTTRSALEGERDTEGALELTDQALTEARESGGRLFEVNALLTRARALLGSEGARCAAEVERAPAYASALIDQARARWSFATIEAGHDCMVTAPDELSSLLMVA
jgi:double zinc ribbon protein